MFVAPVPPILPLYNVALVNITGINYYWGGGGGGGSYATIPTNGGRGGGGAGEKVDGGVSQGFGTGGADAYNAPILMNGGAGSGGGGGGSGFTSSTAGSGGSGVVIIRYILPTKSSVIELVNGTTADDDANSDYKIGNYNSVLKVFKKTYNINTEVLSIDDTTLKLVAPYGITTNSTITGSLRSNGILYADYGIIGTGNIQTTGNIYTASGQITGGNMTLNGTLNSISPSDWLRKSDCVLYVASTTRTQTGFLIGGIGSITYTSVFHIPVNTIRSEYGRPQIQWRLRMAFSSANTNSNNSFGFFNVYYDQYRTTFYQSIESPNSYDYTLSTNFDGAGTSRVIITIINSNSPTHINVNIA